MMEAQGVSVKLKAPGCAIVGLGRIERITQNRMSDGLHVKAQLVRASRFGKKLQPRGPHLRLCVLSYFPFQDTPVSLRGFAPEPIHFL